MLVYYQAVCECNYLTLQNRTANYMQLQYYVWSQKNNNYISHFNNAMLKMGSLTQRFAEGCPLGIILISHKYQ